MTKHCQVTGVDLEPKESEGPKSTPLTTAINLLIRALESDEQYRYAWQAKIAVQFQDAWQRMFDNGYAPETREEVHALSNRAADSFLRFLCHGSEIDEKQMEERK